MSDYVYVIGNHDGPVKVGISSNPWDRFRTIQTSCPQPIELIHTEKMRSRQHARWHENNSHVVYAENRLMGEWFNLDAVLAIECIQTALEIEQHFEDRARQ